MQHLGHTSTKIQIYLNSQTDCPLFHLVTLLSWQLYLIYLKFQIY
jgi:hypothetical protein